MATIWIPPLLQDLTHGQKKLVVPGETVRAVILELDRQYPGIALRLLDEGRIRPGIAVVVDGEVCSARLRQRLEAGSEVHFLPALSGG